MLVYQRVSHSYIPNKTPFTFPIEIQEGNSSWTRRARSCPELRPRKSSIYLCPQAICGDLLGWYLYDIHMFV